METLRFAKKGISKMTKLLNEEDKILKGKEFFYLAFDNSNPDDFDMFLTIVTSRKELKNFCDRLWGTAEPGAWFGLFHYIPLEYFADQTTWKKTDLLAAAYTKYYINKCDAIRIRQGDLFFMVAAAISLLGAHQTPLSRQGFADCARIFKKEGWRPAVANLYRKVGIEITDLHANSSIVDDEQVLHEKMFLSNTAN
ncbi:MAG: hypothetical protein ACLP5H_14965 [Desulfomonilaceae bacterium]